jgi:diguanylate cyclase (GGDEF)-like protein
MDDSAVPGIMAEALGELRKAAGLEGVAIIDLTDETNGPVLTQEVGYGALSIVNSARDLLQRDPRAPSHGIGPDKRPILVCPWALPARQLGGLALWRMPGARGWTAADHALAASVTSLMRVIVEHGPNDASLDRLTGLPNRPYFLDEVNRHIERLELDQVSGTMMMIDLDGLDRLNTLLGRDAGDRMLIRVAALLRAMVRPTDIVARVGADEFAVWLDGMDHMTAAERADSLGQRPLSATDEDQGGPEIPQTFSIGIATRRAGTGEDARTLLRRAHMAMREVKQTGGAAWRVSHVMPRGLQGGGR